MFVGQGPPVCYPSPQTTPGPVGDLSAVTQPELTLSAVTQPELFVDPSPGHATYSVEGAVQTCLKSVLHYMWNMLWLVCHFMAP